MPAALRAFAAAFAALLLLIVGLCTAWWLAMTSFPPRFDLIGQGDVGPLLMGYLLVPAAGLLALCAGVARALVRSEDGSPSVALLARPAVAAALVAGLVMAAALMAGAAAGEAATAAATVAVSAFVALLVAAAVVRLVPLPRLATVTAVVIALAAGALLLAEARGRSRMAAHREAALAEIAAWECEPRAERPVLKEPAKDADAAEVYRPLVEAHSQRIAREGWAGLAELTTAATRPAEPLPAELVARLDAVRPDVEKLCAATRSRRARWSFELGKAWQGGGPSLPASRYLALAAIVDGHQRANAGDVIGAAERYLDVLRFGSDFQGGPLLPTLIGSAVEQLALQAAARLVRSPRGAPARELVDVALERMAPGLLTIGPAWRAERLAFAALGPIEDRAGFASGLGVAGAKVPSSLVPWNAWTAVAVDAANAAYRDLEAAAARGPDAVRELEANFAARHYDATANTVFRAAFPTMQAGQSVAAPHVLLDAVRAAIRIEERRAVEGRYPEDPGPLPADTLAPNPGARLRYRVDAGGAAYTLYGLGADGVDDGGHAERDLLVPAAGWPDPPATAQEQGGQAPSRTSGAGTTQTRPVVSPQ